MVALLNLGQKLVALSSTLVHSLMQDDVKGLCRPFQVDIKVSRFNKTSINITDSVLASHCSCW